MKKLKGKRNKQTVTIVMTTAICLVLLMTVGYAAFSTTLKITAKGNIKQLNAANLLQKTAVTSGDGLYTEATRTRSITNKYVYKGANPENYLKFNDELWRIVSVETDETIKIVKDEPLVDLLSWSTENTNWTNSTIAKYLNDSYYNSFNDELKKLIAPKDFSIGEVTLEKDKAVMAKLNVQGFESKEQWNGNIGTISLSDYLLGSLDDNCTELNINTNNCKNKNYLTRENQKIWTMITTEQNQKIWTIQSDGNIGADLNTQTYNVRPVIYLNADIALTGKGTEENPYTIKSS